MAAARSVELGLRAGQAVVLDLDEAVAGGGERPGDVFASGVELVLGVDEEPVRLVVGVSGCSQVRVVQSPSPRPPNR